MLTKERSVFRNNGAILFLVAVLLACLTFFSGGADAATEGDWEYSLDASNDATIIGYDGAGGDDGDHCADAHLTAQQPADEVELEARVAVRDAQRAHLLRSFPESIQLEAEGVGSPGQHTAGIGLDVHLTPGHFPEGFPVPQPFHVLALQQIPQQEGLHRQRRHPCRHGSWRKDILSLHPGYRHCRKRYPV